MKKNDINKFMKDILYNGGIAHPGVWPNVDPQGPVARPYFEVSFAVSNRVGAALAGGLVRETGTMVVVVCVPQGDGETAANNIADAVSDLFPQAMRIVIPGGLVTIQQPPSIEGGYPDDNNWRVPVKIRYTASNR
jgi:hypothetical protein